MSLFQCQHCGCCENTALAEHGFDVCRDSYDWTGIEDRRGLKLCSACGPARLADGTPCEGGEWHGEFERAYLPMGMFRTASNGNLEHVETGDQDFHKYALDKPDTKRVAVVGNRVGLARMAALLGVAALAGEHVKTIEPLPSLRRKSMHEGAPKLDKTRMRLRDDEARKAKAEAKRQRRRERNRRIAGKEK